MSESSSNLDQILAALQQLQHENVNLRNSVQELQAATTVIPHPIIDHFSVEPNVSLPDKFDGTRSCLRGFINRMTLSLIAVPNLCLISGNASSKLSELPQNFRQPSILRQTAKQNE